MKLLKFLVFCFVFLTGECGISSPQSKFLSQREIAEITKFAEKKIENILMKSTKADDIDLENEIEVIRQKISQSSTGVKCNITAGFLWKLCRPVLLQSCKDKYRVQCRSNPHKYLDFNDKLNQMFPALRIPEAIFKPQPLSEWFEKQIENFTNAIANSSSFQSSKTSTNDGDAPSHSKHHTAKDLVNITRQLHETLSGFQKKYRALFPSSDDSPETEDHLQKILNIIEDIHDGDEVEDTPVLKADDSDPPSLNPPKTTHDPKRRKRSRMRRPGSRPFFRRWFSPRRPPHFHRPPHHHFPPPRHPWERNHRIPPHHRPPFPHIRVPPIPSMEMWTPPATVHPWHFTTTKPFSEDRGIGIECQKMEENPEFCLEIGEEKGKCENILERVCPGHIETRQRIAEKLNDVYARRYKVSQVVTGDGDDEVNEKYEWATKFKKMKQPIVIESIKVTHISSGDAFVRAKLFDRFDVKLEIPGTDFGFSAESFGEAVGTAALDFIGNERGNEP